MNILIIDDDPFALKLACFVLEQAGYTAHKALNCAMAIKYLQHDVYDLILLDVSFPDADGFELYTDIRSRSTAPIVFVTGLGQIDYRVRGLKLGADDYIVKPFEPEELLARIEAILRRRAPDGMPGMQRVSRGGITLDPVRQEVSFADNRTRELTPIEVRLLYLFLQNVGRVLTTDHILNKVWGYDDKSGRNLVAVYIRRLRSKIEPSTHNHHHIKTVANTGYKFDL